MKTRFFVFAPGWLGVALLTLRASVAAFLISIPTETFGHVMFAEYVVYSLALLVSLGLQTRIAALLASVIAGIVMVRSGTFVFMPLAAHALDGIVLLMAGPGAYSLDSRLYGRQTLRLPK